MFWQPYHVSICDMSFVRASTYYVFSKLSTLCSLVMHAQFGICIFMQADSQLRRAFRLRFFSLPRRAFRLRLLGMFEHVSVVEPMHTFATSGSRCPCREPCHCEEHCLLSIPRPCKTVHVVVHKNLAQDI